MTRARAALLRLALVATVAGVAGACSGGGDGGERAHADFERSTLTLRVTGAGGEPRALLDAIPEPRVTQAVTLEHHMDMSVSYGPDVYPPIGVPPVRMLIDVATPDAPGRGAPSYRFTIGATEVPEDPDVDAAARAGLAAELASQPPDGLAGSVVLDGRGAHVRTDFTMPSGAAAGVRHVVNQLLQSLELLATPLPEVPVGIGSTWEATGPIAIVNIALERASTFTLTARDGERASIEERLAMHAPPQLLELPGMPPGSRVELVELRGSGTATRIVDGRHPLPLAADASFTLSLRLRVRTDVEEQPLNSEIRVRLSARAE